VVASTAFSWAHASWDNASRGVPRNSWLGWRGRTEPSALVDSSGATLLEESEGPLRQAG
jgi:hypothetical protein